MQDSAIDDAQIEYLEAVMSVWKTTLNAGQPTGLVADMIFHSETQEVLGADHPAYANVIDFCDFLTFATKDRRLSDSEIIVICANAMKKGLDIEGSERVRELRASFAPKRKWWHFWT